MRMPALLSALVALGLAHAAAGGDKLEKPRRPRLELRAAPRIAFSPARVLLTAELHGGEPLEEFYCPELEWDWDDGGRSSHGADCPPFEDGGELQRRFTAEHAYRRAGVYNVKITMKRANRSFAVATATVTIRAGLGDFSSLDQ